MLVSDRALVRAAARRDRASGRGVPFVLPGLDVGFRSWSYLFLWLIGYVLEIV